MNFLLNTDIFIGLRKFTADQVVSPYIYVFCAAYLVAFIFTPVMRVVASYYGIIDQPDGVRKIHKSPVAYLGGVAVFLAWLTGLAVSQFLPLHRVEPGINTHLIVNFGIVAGACAVVMLGLWDDILHISPRVKILVQVLAAACLLVGGVGRRSAWVFVAPVISRTTVYFGWPGGDLAALQDHWLVVALSIFFVMGVVVVCCNAANLLDGLDGLCGGVTGFVSAGFLFLAVHLAMVSGALNTNQDALRVVLALALLGGVLGFVPYNFNPASIFMGDTGSMFLGFCCATLMILFASDQAHFKWFLAAAVMFSLPLLDTALAFTRRWVNGRPLFSPDRFHLHHQLVARGFSVRQTAMISYGLSLLFCVLGAAIVYIRTRYAAAVYLVVFGSIIVAAVKMGMVHERVRAVVRKPLGEDSTTPQAASASDVLDVRDDQSAEATPVVPAPGVWAENARGTHGA